MESRLQFLILLSFHKINFIKDLKLGLSLLTMSAFKIGIYLLHSFTITPNKLNLKYTK